MLSVTEDEIRSRLRIDNPWWEDQGLPDETFTLLPRRAYFAPFFRLVTQTSALRSVVLLGPRRVGKTVMIQQTIQALLDGGTPRDRIFFATLDSPLYSGLGLEKLLGLHFDLATLRRGPTAFVFFDEVQYLKDWERHLKSLHDSFPKVRFIASGSAAAALRLKSQESGAGRFTDFYLPSLAFCEFLRLTQRESALIRGSIKDGIRFQDIPGLNEEFVNYLNYGGFPEIARSAEIRREAERYVRSDILDKVLLRDLPGLYGISDIQELNRLFTVIAYNTGQEVSLEGLAQDAQISKNTIKRYLEYLEAAFLIIRLPRIDENAQRLKRATHFKVFVANSSMRSALFGPVSAEEPAMGGLVETAIVTQLQHSRFLSNYRYARWAKGEVDLVVLDDASQRPIDAQEVKWSDRYASQHPEELRGLVEFAIAHKLEGVRCTSITHFARTPIRGIEIRHAPASATCYLTGLLSVENPATVSLNAAAELLSGHRAQPQP